jgi:hypothetical protein
MAYTQYMGTLEPVTERNELQKLTAVLVENYKTGEVKP